MTEALFEWGRASVALFVIVDPLGNVPIFLGLASGLSEAERRRTHNTAVLVGSLLLFVFALSGQQILMLFGITLYSFMIAGGILLLLLAARILVSGGEMDQLGSKDVGVFPIAFPLLAGPGAITTTIITLHSSGPLIALASIATVMPLTWLILRESDRLYRFMGRTGSDVVARVMAILIAAIAVEFIVRGIQFYYPVAG